MTLPAPIHAHLHLLACPRCGGALEEKGEAVRCTQCDRAFPVTNGVLEFLPDERGEPGNEAGRPAPR
ncbi:MAG: Trm112 family protein [Polyangiales bacterium]